MRCTCAQVFVAFWPCLFRACGLLAVQPDALDRFHGEQAFTVPAPQLEQHFLHSINDGFVSGANTQAASAATASGGCAPKPSKHGVTVGLHRLPAALPCVDADLCAAARKAAGCSAEQCGAGAELLLVVGAAADAPALTFMLKSAARAGVSRKVLVVATDAALAAALRESGAVGDATVVERVGHFELEAPHYDGAVAKYVLDWIEKVGLASGGGGGASSTCASE